MEIGICTTIDAAARVPASACDFVEVNVQEFLVPEGDEATFERNLAAACNLARPVSSANCFLPGDLKCVGDERDLGRLMRYAETAFRRAEAAGIEIIVFGSGGARTIPEAVPKEDAMGELVEFLQLLGPIAERHHVTIVLEPLGRPECNFINTIAEGAEAIERCNHPHVQLLADVYHMRVNGESADEIAKFAHRIRHIHVAELEGRAWPGKSKEDLGAFYRAIRQADYNGRLALECQFADIEAEAGQSILYLRERLAEAEVR